MNIPMKKFLCMFSLLAFCALWVSAQDCETSEGGEATVRIYRTSVPLLPGEFSVSASHKVRFARGNLRYRASDNSWDIDDTQYENLGTEGGNSTTIAAGRATQSEWIDLFGACTSGWSGSGAVAYQPWAVSTTNSDYGPPVGYNATGEYEYCDWGKSFYAGFRLMTAAEWQYLIRERDNWRSLRAAGQLFGKNGVFLLPDGWDWDHLPDALASARTAYNSAIAAYNASHDPDRQSFAWNPNTSAANGYQPYTSHIIYDITEGHTLWDKLQDAGVVFLPSCGWRNGTTINYDRGLHYYTSTSSGSGWYIFHYREGSGTGFSVPLSVSQRYYGRSVRLVKDVE